MLSWKTFGAYICLPGLLIAQDNCDYPISSACIDPDNYIEHNQELCIEPWTDYRQSPPDELCEEPCEQEYWCREICYEPMFYTTQKAVERQIPTKKRVARLVPKEYTVQRVRYVPQYYTEKIIKNEVEYSYVDDWKIRTEMVCERQCEWIPKVVWKRVAKEETQQDD